MIRFAVLDELGRLNVLVVDDKATSREILQEALESFGFSVTTLESGAQALKQLQQGVSYDLVLMDKRMPNMDGVETIRAMQNDPKIFQAPSVIMVTAYGKEEVMRETREMDVGAFLTKPVNPSHMLEAIYTSLGTGHQNALVKQNTQETVTAVSALCGAHILLVEDNDINQELAKELLENNGMTVEIASNGEIAVQKVVDGHYDGVLMDCQMPIMDGYTATNCIRQMEEFNDLPIIAMTANAMAGDREKVMEAGMNDHIAKPINVENMFSTMAKWITPANPATPGSTDKKADDNNQLDPRRTARNRY